MSDRLPLALSVQQPWAWLIAHGFKNFENRSWPTKVRGPVLIHASQKFDIEGYEWLRYHRPEIPLPAREAFDRGGIVGRATITDCVSDDNSWWFSGPYGFAFAEAEPLPFIPGPGRLGFFRFVSRGVAHV